MIGTIINVVAILICGGIALTTRKQPSLKLQTAIKGLLGVATIFVGLRQTIISMSGGFFHLLKQLVIILLALMIGRLLGRLLHLQSLSNRLGHYAKEKIEQAAPPKKMRFTDGFITASLLFCLAPLAILGSLQDGLADKWQALAIKAVMDGMTTIAFVSTFGASVLAAAVPVLAFQGTIALGAKLLAIHWLDPALVNAANATSGLVVFCVGLVILELKKIELTDYLPSIAVAPVIAWLWKPW